jgi:hypothetical protein
VEYILVNYSAKHVTNLMLARLEVRWEHDTVNVQDISNQITVSRRMHHTSSTIDMNMEIRNEPRDCLIHAVGERK